MKKKKIASTESFDEEPYISSLVAEMIERLQMGKYHGKGGTGFAAEDANALRDRLTGKEVSVTGTNNEANGPDRIVNGVKIQTKYYQTAALTLDAAFDIDTGRYRYKGQVLEVPRDQYDECVVLMRDKITQRKVAGVTNPRSAEALVKRGDVTYKQARNIARAGNIDSIWFDAKTQAVTTSYVFAISFAVHFGKRIWNGESNQDALKGALVSAMAAGGVTLITGIVASQILRSRAAAIGAVVARNGVRSLASTSAGRKMVERIAQASLGRAVYGGAAINHVAKLFRSNSITSSIATAIITIPDFYRAAITGAISWPQFAKNLVINGTGVTAGAGGWMGGAAAGAAIGSVVPIVGTAAGGFVGGILGAIGGGFVGTTASQAIMDILMEDDAKRMLALLEDVIDELTRDFLLSKPEVEELGEAIKLTLSNEWLCSRYQAGSTYNHDYSRRYYAYTIFDAVCLEIVRKRPKIELPSSELVKAAIGRLILAESWYEGEIAGVRQVM